ncbi:MAG: hypothetical protein HQL25_08815 [Candidatus Omnitrophica bacterium]|nr:hypothetical protein [Candidatus Omnitrophota bacterium]
MEENKYQTEKQITQLTSSVKDLIISAIVVILVLVGSHFFNLFFIIVKLFQENPHAITYVDEIISGLVAISICAAVFAWRRWLELKVEAVKRLQLQEEMISNANTKADVERIIAKQLRSELEYHKKIEEELLKIAANRK